MKGKGRFPPSQVKGFPDPFYDELTFLSSAVALALIANMNGKILDAIAEIRNQKKRPCRDFIFDVVTKAISCSLEEFNFGR